MLNRLIRTLIIEDEPVSAIRLERLLKSVAADIEVVAMLSSIKDSVAWLSKHQADLIFLDIHLSDGDSFKIFEQVFIQTPIVFVTAYDQYALQAFRQNSVDYILKPIDKKSLEQSLNKFRTLHFQKKAAVIDYAQLSRMFQPQPIYKKRFLMQIGAKLKIVKVEDIAYCFSEDKTSFLVTLENKKYPVDYSLNQLEKELNPVFFFRINRKFLIHSQAIQEMYYVSKSRLKLELEPSFKAPILVSVEKIGQFKRWLDS